MWHWKPWQPFWCGPRSPKSRRRNTAQVIVGRASIRDRPEPDLIVEIRRCQPAPIRTKADLCDLAGVAAQGEKLLTRLGVEQHDAAIQPAQRHAGAVRRHMSVVNGALLLVLPFQLACFGVEHGHSADVPFTQADVRVVHAKVRGEAENPGHGTTVFTFDLLRCQVHHWQRPVGRAGRIVDLQAEVFAVRGYDGEARPEFTEAMLLLTR